jgi:SAM-dependent methyltransferase
MLIDPNTRLNLNLGSKNFNIPSFWLYRGFRAILLPFGKSLSLKIAVRLHWVFRHLAIALSSNQYGVHFLNSRSAIIQGRLLNLHIHEGNSVVDIACGTARFLPTILEIGKVQYLGIDSSEVHIHKNRDMFPNSQFTIGDCLDFSIIPRCDVIIASHFIEHIDNPLNLLEQIKPLCKKLIIEVPDFYSDPINLVSHGLKGPWWTDRDHRREYSEASLDLLFVEANYRILERKIIGGTIAMVVSPNSV